jgi:hypothetical protein
MKAHRAGGESIDWDATVRRAFLEGCVQQGVRAELATQAIASAHEAETESRLRETQADAARRAALAWLTIETCLQQYGELAALALERCVEEASLQIRRSSRPPSTLARSTRSIDRDGAARAIVERGRERLARFWARDTSAA